MPTRRKQRSPLCHLSRNELRSLRALAREAADWKRHLADGGYRWIRNVDTVVTEGGARPGIWQWRLMDEFESRALDRLSMREDWSEIYEARKLAYLQRFDPAAYEVRMLRRELHEVRADQDHLAA